MSISLKETHQSRFSFTYSIYIGIYTSYIIYMMQKEKIEVDMKEFRIRGRISQLNMH